MHVFGFSTELYSYYHTQAQCDKKGNQVKEMAVFKNLIKIYNIKQSKLFNIK